MTPRASRPASDLRVGKVTFKISGSSWRPRKLIAPARSQVSQPPPSHAAQVRLRGSSNSTTSPASSQVCGTRIRCNTSGPRGTFNVRLVTLARTSDTPLNPSPNRARRHRSYVGITLSSPASRAQTLPAQQHARLRLEGALLAKGRRGEGRIAHAMQRAASRIARDVAEPSPTLASALKKF